MPFTLKLPNIKIPQIARWRISGVSDTRIAQLIHMSMSGLARILASPEYQQYEFDLMNGHLKKMDEALAGKISEIHEECRRAVPAALRCLVDTVNQRRDLRAAMAAAKEILDRDPDRTLAPSDNPNAQQSVPAEMLAAAAEEGNKIASSFAPQDKTKVN